MSPQGNPVSDRCIPSPNSGSTSPPPKPPRRFPRSNSGDHLVDEPEFDRLDHPAPPPPIQPYYVTTITPRDPSDRPQLAVPTSSSSRSSESPILALNLPIPPPPIIGQPRRDSSSSNSAGVYYSLPSELEAGRNSSRVLSEDGTFAGSGKETGEGGGGGYSCADSIMLIVRVHILTQSLSAKRLQQVVPKDLAELLVSVSLKKVLRDHIAEVC